MSRRQPGVCDSCRRRVTWPEALYVQRRQLCGPCAYPDAYQPKPPARLEQQRLPGFGA